MLRLLGYALLFLSIGSCTRAKPFSIRYVTKNLRAPGVSSMSCYFVSLVTDTASSAAKVPACLGIGQASAVMTWDELTGSGASFRVFLASKMKIGVFGVYSAGGCPAGATVESLFSGNRPALYDIGHTETAVSASGAIEIEDSYVEGSTPNTGSCGISGGSLHLSSVLPVEGLHRGGVELTIAGTGFDSGVTVSVGGKDCPATFDSATTLRCTTPNIPAQLADVVVTGAGGTDVLTSSYSAFQVIVTAVNDGVSFLLVAHKQDPVTGLATRLTDAAGTTDSFANLAVHPSGKWVVSSHTGGGGNLQAWSVNLLTGRLTKSGTSMALTGAPTHMTFNPSGTHLYTTIGSNVSVCTFSVLGVCTFAGPFSLEGSGRDLSVSSNGLFLYAFVTSGGGLVDMFPLSAGAVSGAATRVVPLGTSSEYLFFHPNKPTIIQHQATSFDLEFRVSLIDLIGGGTSADTSTTYPFHGAAVRSGGIPESGSSLYMLHTDNSIRRYGLNPSTGVPLATKSDFSPSGSPTYLVTDADGKYFFTSQDTTPNTLSIYKNTEPGGLPSSSTPHQDLTIGATPVIPDLIVN